MINICQYDNKEFKTSHARVKYCSRSCANKAKIKARKTFICKNCRKTYPQKSPSKVPIYCSQKCRNEGMAAKPKECEREECSNIFIPAHKTNKYCSTKCFNIARLKPRLEGDCAYCGEHFVTKYTTTSWHYNEGGLKRRFCSKEHQLAYLHKDKIERECLVCSKVFLKFPSEIENGRGQFCSIKCRGGFYSGEKSVNWKGGITPQNELLRKSPEYKAWRIAIFVRDNKTCILCKKHYRKGYVEIEADHIRPRSLFPELTLDISNGRTLCRKCHEGTLTYGISKHYKSTRADFLPEGRYYQYVMDALQGIGIKEDIVLPRF